MRAWISIQVLVLLYKCTRSCNIKLRASVCHRMINVYNRIAGNFRSSKISRNCTLALQNNISWFQFSRLLYVETTPTPIDCTRFLRPFKISRFLVSRHPWKTRNFAPCENFPLCGIPFLSAAWKNNVQLGSLANETYSNEFNLILHQRLLRK
jgi:hypothetical protein